MGEVGRDFLIIPLTFLCCQQDQ